MNTFNISDLRDYDVVFLTACLFDRFYEVDWRVQQKTSLQSENNSPLHTLELREGKLISGKVNVAALDIRLSEEVFL